jgi:hypothetical protein
MTMVINVISQQESIFDEITRDGTAVYLNLLTVETISQIRE